MGYDRTAPKSAINVSLKADLVKRSLRLVQARRPGNIQELMEEALNDLFAKYDVPQVSGGGKET